MERTPASLGAALRLHATPAAVLVTGTLCALAAAGYVSRAIEAQQQTRFAADVAVTVDAVRDRMTAYTSILRATRGLFDAEGEPDRAGFARFVASLDLARTHPGIQGVGWAKLLRPEEVASHESAVRERDPEYRVWPAGERPVYSAIVHLEPLDWRNQRAIGYDMFSDPTRRRAMERARDTGEVAASERVELVQEAGAERQPGFLMYLPVYARPPRDAGERRQLLLGWTYAPFRAEDLLAGTLRPREGRLTQVAVHDGPQEDPRTLLFRIGGPAPEEPVRLERLEVAGRQWTLAFWPTEALASRAERALPAAVLAAGLAITALLFAITRADARGRARAERTARRAAFLADAGKALAATTDYEWSAAEIAALAARRIADACVILLVEPAGPIWIVGHADTARAARAAERLRGVSPTAAVALGVPEALARAAPALGDAPRAGRGPPSAARAALEALEVRAHLTVPLVARGEPVGAIALLSQRGPTAFEPEDLPLAEDLARIVSAAVDVSRLYRREQEAVAARDEFLSIASHELKTPLTSLILHTDALRSAARRGTPEQMASRTDLIRRSADRLARLVSSLLDISRIGAGRLDLEREETDLAEVTREVVDRFSEEARRAGCELRVQLSPAVGLWDRLRLDQVVTNLLANALKYGAGAPVEVRVGAAGGRAVLTVQDRGIGISEEDQRRIFQRFERAVSQRNYGGFGLGLWIVRQIVEAQGGSVRVESAPGEGSTFTVELERTARARPPAGEARPSAPSP